MPFISTNSECSLQTLSLGKFIKWQSNDISRKVTVWATVCSGKKQTTLKIMLKKAESHEGFVLQPSQQKCAEDSKSFTVP